MPILLSEENKKAHGGTELLVQELQKHVDPILLDRVQIIPGRLPSFVSYATPTILWCHDLPGDPMNDHLRDNGWEKFVAIIFVSYTQKNLFQQYYSIPHSKCFVIPNGIETLPLRPHVEKPEKLKLIYHTTPHRGLNILYAAFSEAVKTRPHVTLDVYSSFAAYGNAEADKPYQELFAKCEEHPNINYHGFQPYDVVREAIQQADIFAYPCTWFETSCRALLEAMSAGLLCIHSDLGSLPETAKDLTKMYRYTENINTHASIFHYALCTTIDNYDAYNSEINAKVRHEIISQKHDWKGGIKERWESILSEIE